MNIPYSLQTYEKLMKDLIEAINRNECISVLELERSAQLYRLDQFVNNISFLKKHVRKFNQTHFLILDLESETIDDEYELKGWVSKHAKENKKNHNRSIVRSITVK